MRYGAAMRKWAVLLAMASCTSFGADPGAGATLDGGSADAPTSIPPADGALTDGGPLPNDAGPACAAWVTDQAVATSCPGDVTPRYLASDPDNCGRCGFSCGGGACEAGHCKDVDVLSGVRLLGAGPRGALLFREQDRQVIVHSPSAGAELLGRIADATPEPVAAVAWGEHTYARTPSALVPYPPIGTIAPYHPSPPTIPPTLAATDAGVFVAGPGNLKRFSHENLLDNAEIQVPEITEVSAAESVPVVIQAAQGSAASLGTLSGNGTLRELVADAGKARSLVAIGHEAFYADGSALMRVSLDGGAPEVLARAPGDIVAYTGRPAVAVSPTTVFFVRSLGKNDEYEVMAVERGCASPTPRRVAFAQNLAGIAANEGYLFYVADTNTVRSQRIASKNQ